MEPAAAPSPIRLGIFEGPLDLLLHLIRNQKLDVYDIPIAEVTRQYVGFLKLMESLDIDLAGEFLVMAATLMEIKSRLLLPKPPKGEDEEETNDPRRELVERLVEYQRFKEAAEIFRDREEEYRRSFSRGSAIEYEPGPTVVIDPQSAAVNLFLALKRLLDDAGESENELPTVRRDPMTLRLKMREVRSLLHNEPDGCELSSLLRHGGTREEIIVTFLAILELLRSGRITVSQTEPLGPIRVMATRASDGPA